jgi:hypothetical protein
LCLTAAKLTHFIMIAKTSDDWSAIIANRYGNSEIRNHPLTIMHVTHIWPIP